MSKKFSPATMFRQASPVQLQSFFKCFGQEVLVTPNSRGTYPRKVINIEPFMRAYKTVEDNVRDEVDFQIEQISALATQEGMKILTDLAPRFQYDHWLFMFRPGDTHYHRVLDVWTNRRAMFDRALDILELCQTVKRNKPLGNLPKDHPEFSEALIHQLQREVRDYFVKNGNRGEHCPIRFMETTPGIFAFVLYPNDDKKVFFQNVNACETIRIQETYAFQMAYFYDTNEGTLEVLGAVSAKERRDLEAVFLQVVFGMELREAASLAIHPEVLRQRDFHLPSVPEKGMEVKVIHAGIRWFPSGRETVLKIGQEYGDDIPKGLDFNYRQNNEMKTIKNGEIVSAVITFSFNSRLWGRQRTVRVTLDGPGQKVQFKTNSSDCRANIMKYLTNLGVIQ